MSDTFCSLLFHFSSFHPASKNVDGLILAHGRAHERANSKMKRACGACFGLLQETKRKCLSSQGYHYLRFLSPMGKPNPNYYPPITLLRSKYYFFKSSFIFFFLEISTSNMGLKLTTPVIKSHIFYWLSQLGVPSVVTATNHLPFLDSIHIQRLYSHHQLSSTEAKYFFLISQVY